MQEARHHPTRLAAAALAAVLVALLLVSCATGDAGEPAGSPGPSAGEEPAAAGEEAPVLPVTVTNADGSTTQVTDLARVVVANGDLTEVVFALGLGDRVVAADVSATYPPAAAALPKVGYQRTLSAEGILAQRPTLVLAGTTAGPPPVIEQVRAAGVPVVVLAPPDPSGVWTPTSPGAKIRAVAAALGVPERGEELASQVDDEIDAAVAEGRAARTRPSAAFLYLRGTQVQLIAGDGSGVDTLLESAGAVDAASRAGLRGNAPMTPEALVAAAPEVLVVTTSGLESVGGLDGLLALPGVAQTPAGRDRRIIAFDDQYLIGGGPRTGEALAELVDGLHAGS